MNGYSIRIGTFPQDSLLHIKAMSDSALVSATFNAQV